MLRRYLKAGQHCVDVGAASGEMTRTMLECVGPSGSVLAIEIDPAKRDSLEKLAHFQNFQMQMTGAGEGYGDCLLYRSSETLASRWHGQDAKKEPVSVSYAPLDDLVGDRPIDLIKLDTQGSEAHVLDGAPKLLKRCPLWIVELWPWGLMSANRTVLDVVNAFRKAGLTPRWSDGGLINDEALAEFTISMGTERNGPVRNILAFHAGKHWNIYAAA